MIKAQNTADVVKALQYCNHNRLTVIPQCGRSGVCAGSAMNRIIKLDEENQVLSAMCGTPLEYIEKYCQERGFTTGHFPQSLPLAQIGGLVSTRSIGQLSTPYGGVEEMLVGLEAVLADGTVIRTKNVPSRAAKTGLVRDTCEVSAKWTDIYRIYENVLHRFPREVENVTQISAHSSHSYTTGTNLYFVFSFSGDTDMVRARAHFDQAWNIIMEETLRFNGSICHHHGVGKYRDHLIPREHGSAYRILEILKDGFDPNRIMNTGTFMPRP
ncbi:MAG: FAD-binding oxidoreductase [Desulfarculales bacterium]|nr:FAD-binding oxidoreductase [Desulfarculales bacterium]